MKKIILILCFFGSFASMSQVEKSFFISVSGKLGNAKFSDSEFKKLTGFVNSNEVLFGYVMSNKLSLQTGIGLVNFSNSSVISVGNFTNLDIKFLEIPLLLNTSLWRDNSNFMQVVLGVGVFGSYLWKKRLNDFDSAIKDKWIFGSLLNFGFDVKVNKNISVGVFVEGKLSPSFMNKTLKFNSNQFKLSLNYSLR